MTLKQQSNGRSPWFRNRWLGIEIGPTGHNDKDDLFMSGITGKEIIEKVANANAEYAVVFFKDWQFAYYNSNVAPKAPGIGERDLLVECLGEAKRHDIPVIAYCIVQHDGATYEKHPEWRMKDKDGNDISPRLCYNSAYLEEVKVVAAEMMAYDIAGFHFDMLDFGFVEPYGCWCDSCRKLFRRDYGMEMPYGVTWDEAWDKMLEFRANSNSRFCRELQDFVQSKRPELSVDYNYHGYPPFNWEVGERPVQHAEVGDFVTAEGLPWIFGHTQPSMLSMFLAGARPGGVVQGVTSRFIYNYHDFTVRPSAEIEWEVFTYRSHGAQCTIVDKSNYDGSLDKVAFERIGRVFEKARRRSEYFGHQPLPEVGIYYSCRTRDWYGREDRFKGLSAFAGAHKALMQSHIPMGMLMDENVSLSRLQEFPVIYVPNVAILEVREVALLKDYTAGGGNLLITGFTGLCDRWGGVKASSDIEELIGARLVKCYTEHNDNYLNLPGSLSAGKASFLLTDIPCDWPMLVWGPMAAFEPITAESFGELLSGYMIEQDQVNVWNQLLSADKIVGPAVLINQFGNGKVIYLPCSLDSAWIGNYRIPEHRKLIRNLVRYLNPNPDVMIDAPLNVETVVNLDAENNRLLIHFVCFNGQATSATFKKWDSQMVLPPIMEEPMLYRAHVKVNRPFKGASVFGAASRVSVNGGEIALETEEIHEVLIVDL